MKSNYINSQWVGSDRSRENINPSDLSDRIDDYAQADAKQTQTAVDAAMDAFAGWSTGSLQARADALELVATELLARKDELGTLLSREEGKTLAEGKGEVARAGQIFRFFAGEVLRQRGDRFASVRPGVDVEVTREPVGVVGLITPWNFPAAIPAWKIAPALAYGNCVVFKPAELVPGSAWALADIIDRSGLPPGVFNLVMGPGREVGQTLLESVGIDAISFTGSVATGRHVISACGARGIRCQVEMGGKNPLVVLDDADIEVAVRCAVQGGYYSTGQRCTASSRFIVTRGIYGRFVQTLTDALRDLRVGHALASDTQIGPVVDSVQLESDMSYLAVGKADGARLALEGGRLKRGTEGYYLAPSLFVDATPSMRIAREEIFGPIACVIEARDYEDALRIANDTELGLSAGICTASLKHATHFRRHAQAGIVAVNLPTAGVDYHVPFGGCKGSSLGSREQGSYAIEFFTIVKTAYTAA